MPKVRKNEKKEDFMSRCIPMMMEEGKDNDQAVAICSSMFSQHSEKKSMTKDDKNDDETDDL